MGHDLVIAHPPGYELDEELCQAIASHAAEAGGSMRMTNDVVEAFDGTQVVYAKSWGSREFYGAADKDVEVRQQFREEWMVDAAKMRHTNSAIFMHCLPVRRNVIVTDSVIDSAASVVIDEAENRLHAQKAILSMLAGTD
jgi:N-acetylornithine carbamoyltransferase